MDGIRFNETRNCQLYLFTRQLAPTAPVIIKKMRWKEEKGCFHGSVRWLLAVGLKEQDFVLLCVYYRVWFD
jgi:hypothetical protein